MKNEDSVTISLENFENISKLLNDVAARASNVAMVIANSVLEAKRLARAKEETEKVFEEKIDQQV
jgi:hypothetical protein